ncbi:MAG: hypothetical protein J5U17_10190 [Candidatus Methanoperedens sp.]|nr:hypothetical protein [Candidatus Methanoperedens sp.]MCE8428665.1 hypothetical protein [Candidatus Methanoperedens sp.]
MQIEKELLHDLLIPHKILESAGIKGRVQIIMKDGELRIVPFKKKSIVREIKGLGKSIQPKKDSVKLVRELRKEWEISE